MAQLHDSELKRNNAVTSRIATFKRGGPRSQEAVGARGHLIMGHGEGSR